MLLVFVFFRILTAFSTQVLGSLSVFIFNVRLKGFSLLSSRPLRVPRPLDHVCPPFGSPLDIDALGRIWPGFQKTRSVEAGRSAAVIGTIAAVAAAGGVAHG